LLTGGQKHIKLPTVRRFGHFPGHVYQIVGNPGHGGKDDGDIVSPIIGCDNSFGHMSDTFKIRN
jgi:hypothetical protein